MGKRSFYFLLEATVEPQADGSARFISRASKVWEEKLPNGERVRLRESSTGHLAPLQILK